MNIPLYCEIRHADGSPMEWNVHNIRNGLYFVVNGLTNEPISKGYKSMAWALRARKKIVLDWTT